MKLTKQDKKNLSSKLGEELGAAGDVFFTSFQGLKFKDIEGLRTKLGPAKGRFRVIRNTVISHALQGAGLEGWKDSGFLKGPVALVLLKQDGDPVVAAKVLVDFGKEFPALKIKGGFATKKWLSSEDCKRLSTIGSRQELLGKLAGTLYTSVAQIAGVLQAPMRDLVLVVGAVENEKKRKA